jgi:hypothetical protein
LGFFLLQLLRYWWQWELNMGRCPKLHFADEFHLGDSGKHLSAAAAVLLVDVMYAAGQSMDSNSLRE